MKDYFQAYNTKGQILYWFKKFTRQLILNLFLFIFFNKFFLPKIFKSNLYFIFIFFLIYKNNTTSKDLLLAWTLFHTRFDNKFYFKWTFELKGTIYYIQVIFVLKDCKPISVSLVFLFLYFGSENNTKNTEEIRRKFASKNFQYKS